MIALSLLLSTNNVFAEPLSIEEMRPVPNNTLPNFRKYRKIDGPYSFIGYGTQFTPLVSRSAISVSHQLVRVNEDHSFEFGLRLSESNPEQGLSFEDRETMYLNDEGEYVQNVFLGGFDFFHVCHFYQPTTEWSIQSYLGTGFIISRHVYFLTDENTFTALRWKGFSSMPNHLTRLPEIPITLGLGVQTKISGNYGLRIRYLHSLTYKKMPEESINVEPTSRDLYQYSMLFFDIFYTREG